jgi:hypothetical protein
MIYQCQINDGRQLIDFADDDGLLIVSDADCEHGDSLKKERHIP